MSKTVFIPECMNPFEVIVNHNRYIYPGGTSQEVPDEVAEVIELHNKGHEERKPPETGGGGGSGDIDALLDGTITEINSNSTAAVRKNMFGSVCRALTTVNFPAATSVEPEVFSYCTALTTANFPAATSVGSNAFNQCTALTTANFPAATSVGNSAFNQCSALTTANIPVATSVGGSAFLRCSELTTADFHVATSVGSSAFRYCFALTALILRNTTKASTLSNSNALQDTPIASGTGYIYVPRDLVDSYKSATNWSTYAIQFRAIEDYPEITGG